MVCFGYKLHKNEKKKNRAVNIFFIKIRQQNYIGYLK